MLLVVLMAASSSRSLAITDDRSNSSDGSNMQVPTRVSQQLLSKSHTKKSLVDTLQTLAAAGMIKDIDELQEASLKRQLAEASTAHAKQDTIYGPIVQSVPLGIEGLPNWEYVNPFAYLYCMSSVCSAFSDMMKSVCVDGQPLRIVIYADGLIPGNPFRPEASRKLQCIYWCIVDWPQHVLQRSFAWPVFSIIKQSLVDAIPGGLSRLMRIVLRIFFGTSGPSFKTGVHLVHRSGDFVVQGMFVGFLADLLGHKEISDWRGSNGVYNCLTCQNCVNFVHRRPRAGEVSSNCSDITLFTKRTNEAIFNDIDEVVDTHARFSLLRRFPNTRFDALCQSKGFNYVPEGLIYDVGLRDVYLPVDHCLRDWQHTMVQDGLANSHVGKCLHAMKDLAPIHIEQVQEFSQEHMHYPSNWGKLEASAFSNGRLHEFSIASFSSTMLTMIPVLYLFMERFCKDIMPDHFQALEYLHHIVGILRLGPETAMAYMGTLQSLLGLHLAAFKRLYGDYVKPKGHHAFHIPDGALWLGKLLSCFVTERKHKAIKRAALYVFRHIEHTVLIDVVNGMFQQVVDGHDLYRTNFLISPHDVLLAGLALRRSRSAVLKTIGHVHVNDLMIDDNARVGKARAFWQQYPQPDLFVELDLYRCVGGDVRVWATTNPKRIFVNANTMIDTLLWYEDSAGIIRVAIPPALLLPHT